jgi:hypothetical protein
VTTTIPLLGDHAVVDVRPGDQDAANTVEEWLKDYATSRDPRLRERIILVAALPQLEREVIVLRFFQELDGCSGQLTQADGISVRPLRQPGTSLPGEVSGRSSHRLPSLATSPATHRFPAGP